MIDWGRGRSRGQAQTWPPGGGGRPQALAPAGRSAAAHAIATRLRQWTASELAPGRLLPWLPVAFGTGIALYFSAEREPVWWAGVTLAVVLAGCAGLARNRPVAFPLVLAAAAVASGFAVATFKSIQIAHPILEFPAGNVLVQGFVEAREERDRSDRIVVQAIKLEGTRLRDKPDRVRVSVRKGTAPPVGSYVSFRARLSPPLAPLRPGGYDFARDLYFQGVGATGFVLGAIKTVEAPVERNWRLRAAAAIQGLRDAIDGRIRAVIPGDRGAIASALITGKRDAISAPVNDAMYVSGLGHVLSISGYHMVIVAGVVFFAIRALLALVPLLASRQPIKKWAAACALVAAGLYLMLSGAEVATQRAFIMTAIVLIAVMVDRSALTLRTLSVAAFGVLIIAPQAVVHPSFQMSFAATLALIAMYERGMRWAIAGPETSAGARVALWGGREIINLVLASLVAGLATTIFIAFHFHRLTPYSLIANLLAMPIVSAWVMPAGVLGLLAIPFGFDGDLWRLMGLGIDWMIAVSIWVAGLPGAVGRIAAFGIGPLLLSTAGLIVLCLLKSPLRWCGAVLVVLATAWAVRTPMPHVLISADGHVLAVRGADGRLAMHRQGSDTFSAREWLAADGDARQPKDPSLTVGFMCDISGCTGRLVDGKLVALTLMPDAFEDDCQRAILVVTTREAPPHCAAPVIDRRILRAHGAIALTRFEDRWEIQVARPAGQDRPWARSAAGTDPEPSMIIRPAVRDATPRPDDLEPGDAQ
jgi:competence protein ComEC